MLETGEGREGKRDEQDEAGEERLVEGTDPDKKFDHPASRPRRVEAARSATRID